MLALHPLAIHRIGPTWGKWSYSEKERMQQLLFGNTAWFVGTSIFLIVAIVLASTCPSTSIPIISFSVQNFTITFDKQYKLSDKAIVSEDGPTLTFKILLPVLFSFGFASLGLIYYNAKENIDDDEGDQEENIQDNNHRVFKDKGTETM